MNEKNFLRQINSKKNKNGMFTYLLVCHLLSSSLSKPKLGIMQNIVKFFKSTSKSETEIIRDNFAIIIEKVSENDLLLLIKLLMAKNVTLNIVKENFPMVLNKLLNSVSNIESMYASLNKQKLLEENIDYILQMNPSLEHLNVICPLLKNKSVEINQKLEEHIRSRKIEIAKFMLEDKITYKDGVLEKYAVTLNLIIEELLESESRRYLDICQTGNGTYSRVYRIGNKVLKVGEERQTYNIPNHRRILQHLIRTNFYDEKEEKVIGCVEISNRVRTLRRSEKNVENLYEIYKELRECGIVWKDVKFENIGVLLSENSQTLNGSEINVSPNSIGFDRKLANEEILPSGAWVIIDSDYLYYEGEEPNDWQIYGYDRQFEERYELEKTISKQELRQEKNNIGRERDE